jgi:hypothetical protein
MPERDATSTLLPFETRRGRIREEIFPVPPVKRILPLSEAINSRYCKVLLSVLLSSAILVNYDSSEGSHTVIRLRRVSVTNLPMFFVSIF